jgi:hypothetical protein
MQKFGHGSVISFDATFGINQSKVCPFCYCMKCHIINMFHNIVTNVGIMFFTIPFVTLMVFDEWQNGILVAFIVIGKSFKSDLDLVL